MFDRGYNYYKVTHQQPNPTQSHIINRIYAFTTDKGYRHLVHVYEYQNKVFVIKFHLADHNKDSKKYHRLTNHFECPQILRTVIDICLKEVLHTEKHASFAFIGVPKISNNPDKTENPKTIQNQRFRIYKMLSESVMGTETFKHVESENANGYILINKNNPDFEELSKSIPQMFVTTFQDYGLLLSP